MDFLSNLALGFSTALSFDNLIYAAVGCILGTLIGVLPGLSVRLPPFRCCCLSPSALIRSVR